METQEKVYIGTQYLSVEEYGNYSTFPNNFFTFQNLVLVIYWKLGCRF